MKAEVLRGLRESQKRLPPKLFYDRRGSELFEKICELDEYYLTRAEAEILSRHGEEMVAALGPPSELIDIGSGSSSKTELLLRHLPAGARYIPVDISHEFLLAVAERISQSFPILEIQPICADFTQPFKLPQLSHGQRAAFFSGSTIGNFDPEEAVSLLRSFKSALGRACRLLVGVDLLKDTQLLEAAYDDRDGVTREFNLNMLGRLNRELAADFDLAAFEHRAFFNSQKSRIEMHLLSTRDGSYRVGGEIIQFRKDETIHTENSHKYSPQVFAQLVAGAGLKVDRSWSDERGYFGIFLLSSSS